jgi:hypothetical protein
MIRSEPMTRLHSGVHRLTGTEWMEGLSRGRTGSRREAGWVRWRSKRSCTSTRPALRGYGDRQMARRDPTDRVQQEGKGPVAIRDRAGLVR